jgi:2-oxoisovalerate dehydrogenase E2 component (dihydrolipoyl transacylase)
MGTYVFKLPDVGEGTAEAEIVAWHVKVGDVIAEDQNLVDVMTDKATVEMTSPVAGKVLKMHGEPGEMAPVGAPLVELEVEGAGNAKGNGAAPSSPSPPRSGGEGSGRENVRQDVSPIRTGEAAAPPVAASKPIPATPPHPSPLPPAGGRGNAVAQAFTTRTADAKPLASPAVRQRAHELGIALQYVPGTGPAGRISHADLDAFVASGGRNVAVRSSGGPSRRDGTQEVKVIGLRRKIAEKMQDAKRRIPHFAYVEEVDMTELEALRAHLNKTKKKDQPKLTVLPFFMRALVKVLPDYPQINARFDDEAGVVHRYAPVHIGIATQTANGLIVPVVHHAEALDVWQSALEVARVSAAARENKATKDELSGSTITITSLGPLGGVVTTPVINHPEVAIIGPNAIIDRPVVQGGAVVVRKMMNLSSSFDHRVVDGYDAAEFIQRVKALLEHPALLFME